MNSSEFLADIQRRLDLEGPEAGANKFTKGDVQNLMNTKDPQDSASAEEDGTPLRGSHVCWYCRLDHDSPPPLKP